VDRDLAETRERAKAMVMAGWVEVEGKVVEKPGISIPISASIRLIKDELPFVSRGGVKLDAAISHFDIDVNGKTVMDVGASTGGFTDCLLKHGASRVIAVDVGYGQLDWKLRQDPRVDILERTNIRYLKADQIQEPIHGAVIDVSFISLRLVVPPVSDLLMKRAFMIALIKPQFEVGRGQVGKGGVVRDPEQHKRVIESLWTFFEKWGWNVHGYIASPLKGPKGNLEFLIYLTR
jgi:23S rRNA (cytidine1920-2'-O)/16S rRNA (cytidine1409-2'-O)-methyltransferase